MTRLATSFRNDSGMRRSRSATAAKRRSMASPTASVPRRPLSSATPSSTSGKNTSAEGGHSARRVEEETTARGELTPLAEPATGSPASTRAQVAQDVQRADDAHQGAVLVNDEQVMHL